MCLSGKLPAAYLGTWAPFSWASQVALEVKNLPINTGDSKRHGFDPWVGKISRSRKLATHSSWTEDPGRLQSIRSQRFGHNWACMQSRFLSLRLHPLLSPWVISSQYLHSVETKRGCARSFLFFVFFFMEKPRKGGNLFCIFCWPELKTHHPRYL